MIFFLTLQAFKNKNNGLKFMDSVIEDFDNKVSIGMIGVSDVRDYAWSIDEIVVQKQEDLLRLSISCKTVVYIMMFGDDCCFDLNLCSFMAVNILFTYCYYRNLGVVLDTPYLIHQLVEPNYLMEIYFEGVHLSVRTETPFELFSAGVKDLCRQLEERIKGPILLNTYEEIVQTNQDIEEYAEKLNSSINEKTKE